MTSTTMDLLPLVCLCLLTWSGTTFGENVTVAEGSDAILPCSFSSNIERLVFDWKKDGVKEVFLYGDGKYYGNGRTGQDKDFEGRVLHFQDELKNGNASIKILNTKMTDGGKYSCTFPTKQESVVTLVVDPDPERFILKDRRAEISGAITPPYIETFPPTDKGVKLLCKVQGASPQPDVQWQDSHGNTLTAEEPQVTTDGERYNVIVNVTVTNSDYYYCVATQKNIYHQVRSKTHVTVPDLFLKDRTAENPGAAPRPYVTIRHQTKDWSLLQCEVQGASPQPDVQWQDSDGNTLTAEEPQVTTDGERYDVIINVKVTKTDTYRCVVTQKEIGHQIKSGIYVHINGSVRPVGLIIVVTLLVVAVAVLLLLVLRAKGYIRCNKENQTPQNNEFKMVNSHET